VCVFAGHAATVALQVYQRCAGHAREHFHLTIERFGVGYQAKVLVLQHVGHLKRGPLGGVQLAPRTAAFLGQPARLRRNGYWPLAVSFALALGSGFDWLNGSLNGHHFGFSKFAPGPQSQQSAMQQMPARLC
jgi:hypothetical protein